MFSFHENTPPTSYTKIDVSAFHDKNDDVNSGTTKNVTPGM